MNKKDLIDIIAKKVDITKSKAEEALDAVFEGITLGLKKDSDASFVGFGRFSVHERKAREGRNPRTGEKIKIAAAKVTRFKPGKDLKGF